MTTPNRPCTVDGSKMYYDIEDITEGKTVKGAFEAKFLIDTVEAIKGQCFAVHQHCKGLYPEVKGPEAGRKWLTSVDQDNDISLQQTLDKSDIPILYNTPRFCDPGITKSRNWGLKNYIQTRLYLYKRHLKNNSNSTIIRNSSKCYSSVVFDFRPFVFSMKLPVIQNATSGRQTEGKKLYFLQWMEIESGSEYGYKANTAIYDDVEQMNAQIKNQSSSVDFFKKLVMNYSKKGMAKKSATNIQKNDITITNNQLNGFMNFLASYDGIKFGGNSNLNVKQQLKSITLTDDVLRMFYFDLMHDLAKGSQKFKKLTFIEFKESFMYEFRRLKGVHRVRGLAGAGTTATSYQTYETLIQKRNIGNMQEIPAIFKTIGDLSQYLYAAKYGTTVGSGDRMGIAVGLYICAKIGIPVKTMIEDGITGFILYTGRKDVKLSGGSSCAKNNNAVNACSRNAKIAKSGNIITNTLNSTPRIAAAIADIEKRKPSTRLPSGMKGLMTLWRNSAPTMNAAGVAEIIRTYYAFDGYWSKNDLKKFSDIVKNIQTRNNIKSNGEIGRKLNVLNGRIRGFLPNNGSPSRSGLKRTRSNVNTSGGTGTTPIRRIFKARRPTPTPTPTPPTNNSARRKTNLNAYITRLQNNLRNKGSNHNFNKNFWLKQLNGNENTNRRLEIIKNQVKGTYNVKIRELEKKKK
tara:strand:+ start:658 stop:2715 length:2058 start_codon:yes stop_codon:yes gene_type:complete